MASVSEDGFIVAHENGETQITVSIGGIRSEPFPIRVNQSSLTIVSSIEGPETLERCLPQDYYVVGRFDDLTDRTLTEGVSFDVVDASRGVVTSLDNANASLNALLPGELILTATAGNVLPATRRLNVLSNLESIDILPTTAAVNVGNTFEFTATGTYNSNSGETNEGVTDNPVLANTRSSNITANVNWEVVSGDAIASIGNTAATGGQLLGLAAGNAVVQASCGDLFAEQQSVVINASTSSESDQLSINLPRSDGVLEIAIGEQFPEQFPLEVQRGSEFDEDDEEANLRIGDLRFSVTVENGVNADIIDTTRIDDGFVRGLTAGTARVTVELLGDNNAVEATGSFTVRVTSS